jgi:hypothetical protein
VGSTDNLSDVEVILLGFKFLRSLNEN